MEDLKKILKDQKRCTELSNKIFKRCMSLTMNRQDAQEIAQDSFLKAWEKIDTFDGNNHEAWMFTIARNTFLDRVRRGYYSVRTGGKAEKVKREDLYGDTLPDAQGLRAEEGLILGMDLEMCLQNLPMEEREILEMIIDMNYQDIADELQITNGNVRVKVSRARTMLHDCLEGDL